MSSRKLIRTVRFHELGGPEVLTIDSLASPSLQATDVRIAVKVVGLNRADAMFRRGSYIEKADFPSRIGYEASGIVIEVGGRGKSFTPWGRGLYCPSDGAFSEWLLRRRDCRTK